MSQMNRREFVSAVACAACLCGLKGATLLADNGPATAPSTSFDVGVKSDYTADSVTMTWTKAHHVAVVRHNGKIFASTTTCTHRHGPLGWHPDQNTYICPNHGARFDIDGNVTQGPARRPLIRYGISVDANQHLIVDQTQMFTADQWDDPASFVKI